MYTEPTSYEFTVFDFAARWNRHFPRDETTAFPKDAHVFDFVATIYQALGYGAETRVTDLLGRTHYIVQGKPVRELF